MSLPEAVGNRIDARVGAALEGAMRARHRHRLRRVGRESILRADGGASRWVEQGAPPRAGNALDVLVDGAEALPAIAAALEGAHSHVHLAGWHLLPEFALTRDTGARRVRDLLAEVAERVPVRVLLWAGAPLPRYQPNRAQVRRVRERLVAGTRIMCALDAHERPLHCHHEKLVAVDDRLAFVGGIDLTSLAGDRFDRPGHPARGALGWHDVATRLRGPAVADVAGHFSQRWRAVTGEQLPPAPIPTFAGDLTLQIVRTVPERVYRFAPTGEFGILEAYLRALRSARRLIYLENQYLWSPEVVSVLADKLRRPPAAEFRLVLVLPAKPKGGGDDTRGQLGVLLEADAGHGRLVAATIRARSDGQVGPVYVHAKVGIVDDEWLTVGSANLNEHSLFNDTEMNVVSDDAGVARATRLRLWSEHLELPLTEVEGDARALVDEVWGPVAAEQLERKRRGEPPTHRLIALEGLSRRSGRLLGPLQGLVVDG